ncbi:unnamed protein product [Amoebophrya sp. A25]|nr:unnamed protein product [Amoebophrya sp. A25]|eukprot:GSA25T00021284001.1
MSDSSSPGGGRNRPPALATTESNPLAVPGGDKTSPGDKTRNMEMRRSLSFGTQMMTPSQQIRQQAGARTTVIDVGRLAFEDAKYRFTQAEKADVIADRNAGRSNISLVLDTYFGGLICFNMLILGIETDHGDEYPPGPRSPFWWIESIILACFIVEFYLRLKLEPVPKITVINASDENATGTGGSSSSSVIAPAPKSNSPTRMNSSGRMNNNSELLKWNPKYDSALTIMFDEQTEEEKEENAALVDVIELTSNNAIFRLFEYMFKWLRTYRAGHYSWLGLDLLVIIASAVDVWGVQLMTDGSQRTNVSALRILRLLRVLRSIKLIRYFKDLWLLVHGLGRALRSIFWVMMLLALMIYCCALFLTAQVRDNEFFKARAETDERFANLLDYHSTVMRSMLTLFQVTTLEEWPQIVRPMMEETEAYGIFFTWFIVTTNFMMMSLFIGILVENLTTATETADLRLIQQIRDQQEALTDELCSVFDAVDVDQSGFITIDEFKKSLLRDEDLRKQVFRNLEVRTGSELEWLFEILDTDGNCRLSLDEFVAGILRTRNSEVSCMMLQMQNRLLREMKRNRSSGPEAGTTTPMGGTTSQCVPPGKDPSTTTGTGAGGRQNTGISTRDGDGDSRASEENVSDFLATPAAVNPGKTEGSHRAAAPVSEYCNSEYSGSDAQRISSRPSSRESQFSTFSTLSTSRQQRFEQLPGTVIEAINRDRRSTNEDNKHVGRKYLAAEQRSDAWQGDAETASNASSSRRRVLTQSANFSVNL